MAPAPSAPARGLDAPQVAAFSLDRLEVVGDELIVEGSWSGVRGMRFLRPAVVVDGRQVLATLAHKPWAPHADPWIATFPWDGDTAPGRAWLEVAPSVSVPLGRHRTGAPLAQPPAATPAPEVPEASSAPAAPAPLIADDPVADQLRDEATSAARAAEEATLRARTAEADRDRAVAMHDEAVRDREAALRTRERMVREQEEARASAAAARAETDAARTAAEHLRVQRDAAVAAHRTLEQVLRHERADREREQDARPEPVTPVPRSAQPQPQPAVDADEAPIGVRVVPAAELATSRVLAARTERQDTLQPFDRWALRVLGTAAATSFVLLLVLLLRVFI